MNYSSLECFGYSIDLLPASKNTKVQLVCLSQKSKCGLELWVDSVSTCNIWNDPPHSGDGLEDRQHDPSVLWDSVMDYTPGVATPEPVSLESLALERLRDEERYRDMIPASLMAYPEEASLLIPGPIVSTRFTHKNVPTAEEMESQDHPHSLTCALPRPVSPLASMDSEMVRFPTKVPYPALDTLSSTKKTHITSKPPGPNRMFEPEISQLNKVALQIFMKEVKNRHASTGLPLHSFWPSSLSVHLSIELTASLLNSLPENAEEKLVEFVSSVRNEDRLALGFLSKWHSLYPYYCLIRASHYIHLHQDPSSVPLELHALFTPKST